MGCDLFKSKKDIYLKTVSSGLLTTSIDIINPCACSNENKQCLCAYVPVKKSYNANVLSCLSDFKILNLIGEGAYGKVYFSQSKLNSKYYAIKSIRKKSIKNLKRIYVERLIMEKVSSPFINCLEYAFQDEERLYFVTDFAQGGDLFIQLSKEKYFSEERAKFYLCELILAIDSLHKLNVIYRDLKPENILLFSDGHIKLTDFGLARVDKLESNETKMSFCGSVEYLAPEIYDGIYGKEIDWWSLGVVYYQMLTGTTPFNLKKASQGSVLSKSSYTMLALNKSNLISTKAFEFIEKLLNPIPEKRLGYGLNGTLNIMNDKYLKNINFEIVKNKLIKPPYKPFFNNDADLRYFDTSTIGISSFDDIDLFNKIEKNDSLIKADKIDGFTFNKDEK